MFGEFSFCGRFDLYGVARYGLQTVRIEGVTAETVRTTITEQAPIGPSAAFLALQLQVEAFGWRPKIVVRSLTEPVDAITL